VVPQEGTTVGLFKKKPKEVSLSLLELPSDGSCAVAGESHYEPALIATRGDCVDEFERRPSFVAALVPEPDNPYDRNAIAVYSSRGKLATSRANELLSTGGSRP
jgi:hypothetical protein